MNNARNHSALVERLEHRTMLAAQLSGGLLTVTGTGGRDSIEITLAGSDQVTVKMNRRTQTFARPEGILVRTNGGSDTVNIRALIPTTVYGGAGNDTIRGGQAPDLLYGEGGADSVSGGGGYDTLFGGTGNDNLHAGFEGAELHGDAGNDLLNLSDDGGIAYGDAGKDRLITYGGGALYGGDGDDLLRGSAYMDSLYGEAGNDTLYGNAGPDTGNGPIDLLDGGAGTNQIA